jgi:serine/threonine protein kinase
MESKLINLVISQFKIEELIGNGAFAYVYRAYHLHTYEPVAIKIFDSVYPD